MNIELIFFILSFFCSVFFSEGVVLSNVEKKIKTLAKQYSSFLEQNNIIFKDLDDGGEAMSELDPNAERILNSISTEIQNMINEGKQFIEALQEKIEKYDEVREKLQLQELSKINKSSKTESEYCTRLLTKITQKNDTKFTRIAFNEFRKHEKKMLIVGIDENNNNEEIQRIKECKEKIINFYNNTAYEKLEEVKTKIESKASQQFFIPSHNKEIYDELEQLMPNQDILNLKTQLKIVEIERMLAEEAEQNMMTITAQAKKSNRKYIESVEKKLGNLNDADRFYEEIRDTISEVNEPETNYMILEKLYSREDENKFNFIEEINEYNSKVVKAKLLKILKRYKDDSGVSSSFDDYFLQQELDRVMNSKIYFLSEENENYLTEASHYAIHAEKRNLILSKQWIKSTESKTIEWMLLKLQEIENEYTKNKIYLSPESEVFKKLEKMISDLNPKQIYLDIALTMQHMTALEDDCIRKRNELFEKTRESFSAIIRKEVDMLEELNKTKKCDANLLLPEIEEMITENSTISVNEQIIKLLDDLNMDIDDHVSLVKHYNLRNETASFINKEGDRKVQNTENRMKRIMSGSNINPLSVPFKPEDPVFKDCEMAITHVISHELFTKIKDRLSYIADKSKIFQKKDEILEKTRKLMEMNTLAYNESVNSRLNYFIYLHEKVFRDVRPDNPAFQFLKELIDDMHILHENNVFLIHEAIHAMDIKSDESWEKLSELGASFENMYIYYTRERLRMYYDNHSHDEMVLLEKLEGMISTINDMEVNKGIQDVLMLIKCSDEECEEKRDEVMRKLKEAREINVTRFLTSAYRSLLNRAVSGWGYLNFSALLDMVWFMETLENPTLEELVIILLTSCYDTSLKVQDKYVQPWDAVSLMKKQDELVEKWLKKCKNEDLKEKYRPIIANYYTLSRNRLAFEQYILSYEILQKIQMPKTKKEQIQIPENIHLLIKIYQENSFGPLHPTQSTDNLKVHPSRHIDGDSDSQHGRTNMEQDTENSQITTSTLESFHPNQEFQDHATQTSENTADTSPHDDKD